LYDSLPDRTIVAADLSTLDGTVVAFGLAARAWTGRTPTDEWFAVTPTGSTVWLPIDQDSAVRRSNRPRVQAVRQQARIVAFGERNPIAPSQRRPTAVGISVGPEGPTLEQLFVVGPSPLEDIALAEADSQTLVFGPYLGLHAWSPHGIRSLASLDRTAMSMLSRDQPPGRPVALERLGDTWVGAWASRDGGLGSLLGRLVSGSDRADPARLHLALFAKEGGRFRSRVLHARSKEKDEEVDGFDLRCDPQSAYVLMAIRPWKRPIRLRLATFH
jgi:hypothetical protein